MTNFYTSPEFVPQPAVNWCQVWLLIATVVGSFAYHEVVTKCLTAES